MYRVIQGQTQAHNVAIPTLPPSLMTVPIRKNVWGPMLWKTFHGFGRILKNIVMTDERARLTRSVYNFTGTLIGTIPCPSCRNHAKDYYSKSNLKEGDIQSNPSAYEDWAFTFHNVVNGRLGKSQYTKEELFQSYLDWSPEYFIDQYLRAINSITRLNFNDRSVRASASGLIGELTTATQKSQEIISNTLAIIGDCELDATEAIQPIQPTQDCAPMPDDESESTIVDNVVFTVPEPGEATDEYDPSEYEISG
jgi:hypothetical protein